jgi:hypothetical protein
LSSSVPPRGGFQGLQHGAILVMLEDSGSDDADRHAARGVVAEQSVEDAAGKIRLDVEIGEID